MGMEVAEGRAPSREELEPLNLPTYSPTNAPIPDGVVIIERLSTAQDVGPKLNRTAADVVRFLAKAGGLPAIDGAKNAAALLPGAAQKKHLAMVKLLIEQGAPPAQQPVADQRETQPAERPDPA